MNDTIEKPSQKDAGENPHSERSKQVSAAGWTASLATMFAVVALINQPTWPVAFGVATVAVMVTVVCGFMLKR
jgi:hypothetical protein